MVPLGNIKTLQWYEKCVNLNWITYEATSV